MAATREYAARHAPDRDPAAGRLNSRGWYGADELACKLNLTWPAAADQMCYASRVSDRLPRTFAALAAGKVRPVHVKIIEDETNILSPEDAAEADEKLAEAAQSKTWAQLRSMAHRLVLKLDPDAARRRKERARQDAHVRRFREDSGNAGMTAREMPADEVLASWQHVEQRALDLRAAGVPGTLQELRVRALTTCCRNAISAPPAPSAPTAHSPAPRKARRTGTAAQADRRTGTAAQADRRTGTAAPAGTAAPGAALTAARPGPARAVRAAAPASPSPVPARASRRWSPSPCPGPLRTATPAHPGKPPGSACSTPAPPAT
jgi:hypothetical protein